jgi:hypothetical protein
VWYVGYRFPDYDKRAASVLNPSDVRWAAVKRGETWVLTRSRRRTFKRRMSSRRKIGQLRPPCVSLVLRHIEWVGCSGCLDDDRNCKSSSEEERLRISPRRRS